MGVDIHGWIEARYSPHEPWEGQATLHYLMYRDYDTFGRLFNVRHSVDNPVAELRGLPGDLSDFARITEDFDGRMSGAYNHSWIGYKELLAVQAEGHIFKDDWQLLLKVMHTLCKRHEINFAADEECVRLVVWFSY